MIILADTGFWIALCLSHDPFHQMAQKFLKAIDDSVLPVTIATTPPVLTEVFHLLRRADFFAQNDDKLPEKKLGKARREVIATFWTIIEGLKVQIFPLEDELSNCRDYVNWHSNAENAILDYPDFHIFSIAQQYDVDAIISTDRKDMIRVKNALRPSLYPVLLLLPNDNAQIELQKLLRESNRDDITGERISAIEKKITCSTI